MICARCQTPNPEQSEVCLGCGAFLSRANDTATIDKLETASLSFDEDFGPRYHVECILGMGGMGRVYRAHDKELDRTVALKVLRQDAGEHPLALQRFKQELQLASRVTHPNILRIHDLGECRGLKFISMQYVDGGDLLQILRKEGALPLPRAVPIMEQLCEALQAAHSANVVHRDLKPQNILVGESDHVFISDFGVAKSIESSLTGMTRAGAILGTPKYMSTEQVQGKPVDHRTDIYSLGLIFYEILTGALPFNGDSTYQLMYQRVHELPRRPELLNPQIPPYLSAIVLRCLERDPTLRYQSAAEILADLRGGQSSGSGLSRQLLRALGRPRSRKLFAAGALLGTFILGVLAFYLQQNHFKTNGSSAPVTSDSAVSPSARKSLLLIPLRRPKDQTNLTLQAEGILNSLSGRLSQLRSLQIETLPADNSVNQQDSPQGLAREAGCQFYLTGSLNEVSGKLYANLSLQDTTSGKTTWSQEFSALPQDVFTMQDEIYNKLLVALSVKPTTEELALGAARPTESVNAYDLYLRGRAAIRNQRSVQTLQSAMNLYNEL